MAQKKQSFDSTLHDMVYSLDAGVGLKIIRTTLYVMFVGIMVFMYTATQFKGLNTEEAIEYAQLGRNFSFKDGLVTKCVRPASIWAVGEHDGSSNPQVFNHPDLYHAPAYPAVLSAGFTLFTKLGVDLFSIPERGTMSAERWAVIPINHLFAILTGFIVYRMGIRLFSREVGFLAMTIFYLSDVVWRDSVAATGISMATFFGVTSFYCMLVAMMNRRDKQSKAAWIVPFVGSILCATIAFLTRYVAIALVPGLLVFSFLLGGRFRGGVGILIAFCVLYGVLIAPWLYRNYKVCGNPAGLVMQAALADSEYFPENTLARSLEPKVDPAERKLSLSRKWVGNISGPYKNKILGMGGSILMPLFICTFFYRFVRPQVANLRWGVLVSLSFALFLGGFFSGSSIDLVHMFWPFVILYGFAFYMILVERLDVGVRLYQVSFKVLAVVLASLPLLLTFAPPHLKLPYPPYYAPFIGRVSSWLGPREVMCSDMPWATAWYGDRVSILLPKTTSDFYEINDFKQPIRGLYLTPITKGKPLTDILSGPEESWLPVIQGRPPVDFPLQEAIMLNGHDQVFVSDYARWAKSGVE